MIRICITVFAALALAGCSPKEEPEPAPVRIEVQAGETYEDVLGKLGSPNLESKSKNSVILIYDDIEIKLQSNVVVEVFDHR